ncbi:MAG: tRNA pseudouridine(55) synthase TruB [Candidatus Saccharibacteria bacterium]
MKGILLVDKPVGWTSFDVVGYVRKIIATEQKIKPAQIKVGHAGTLDPLASGLLLLLIGKEYTKKAGDFSKLDKKYLVDIKLGETTESGDRETEPKFYSDYKPTRQEVDQSLKTFEGKSMQMPPIYSALKVNGQRAYKMARQGKTIELKARPVNIYNLELLKYDYPVLKLDTRVSSGTYIRSLVFDLGNSLKSGAYMTDLKRTVIGDFKLEDAVNVEKLDHDQIEAHLIFV